MNLFVCSNNLFTVCSTASVTSRAISMRSFSSAIALSALAPNVYAPAHAALKDSRPWLSIASVIPLSTSPLPPFARPLLPFVFRAMRPSWQAITLRYDFSSTVQPHCLAYFAATSA